MPNQSSRFALALALIGCFVGLASCSSKFRSDGEASENTSGSLTGTTTGTLGTTGTQNTTGSVGSTTNGTSLGTVGSSTTGAPSTGGTGGTGGLTTTDTDTSTSTSGGGTGSTVVNCETASPDCLCDATGCFLIQGASCTQATDCKTQVCGVTQEASNVCCAMACGQGQVCSADGSGCEAEAACEDELERCSAEGNHERCTGGQWASVEECGGRGCSLDLTGGCLRALGTACAADDECGAGSCLEAADGSSVCCDASCGDCQVCDQAGTGCADPAEVKPNCDCTQADVSNCNDSISCTTDTCDDGRCVNDLDSGYCLIDGQCIDHNQQEPGNSCRYCDATVRDRAWTNSSNTVSCDDGTWCNGSDSCNGSGQCQHQFPTSNRCTESGDCALTSCDESRDSCYRPDGYVCSSTIETRCESANTCGADVQTRTISTSCSGTSAACNGTVTTGSWADSVGCASNQKCDADSLTCGGALNCGDTWCDSSSDLCWTLSEPSPRNLAEATDYCDGLSLAGRGAGSWRLPTINEWLALAKGCDEDTGTAQTESFQSTCEWDGSATITPCSGSCPQDSGPGNGCYWPSAMGSCASVGYWSSTFGAGTYFFEARTNWAVSLSDGASQAIRCVTEQ